MSESTTHRFDKLARLIEARPAPENRTKSLTPPFRPLVAPPMKGRGPVIAGGIVRFDLGANEQR